MNDTDLYRDLRKSVVQLLQVIDQINGKDFDVYKNKRTRLLVTSLHTLEKNNNDEIASVAEELMKSIYRWYDGGFKSHSDDERKKQGDAVLNVFESAVQYLVKHGNERQRQRANEHLT